MQWTGPRYSLWLAMLTELSGMLEPLDMFPARCRFSVDRGRSLPFETGFDVELRAKLAQSSAVKAKQTEECWAAKLQFTI